MCHLKTGKESQSDYIATVKESLDILVRVGGGETIHPRPLPFLYFKYD